MNVKELVEQLKNQPQDAAVVVEVMDYGKDTVEVELNAISVHYHGGRKNEVVISTL